MPSTASFLVALCLAVASVSVPLTAQTPLTLRDALTQADHQAYANRIATATYEARRAQALQPYRGILPAVRVEAGYVRTTDPISAFGTKLRQRAIGAADFDPARLNFPAAVGDHSVGLVLEQPLLNADAWIGRSAAGTAAKAQAAATEWQRTTTRVDVVRAYFGVALALERRATLAAAERAAEAHVARARALADTGLVTRADALLAAVRAGEVHLQSLGAASDAAHAARALATLLGAPAARYDLTTALPAAGAIRSLLATDTPEGSADTQADARTDVRADVRAGALASTAARADARRAKALMMPRVNGFARYGWNDRAGFFANERSWTAGVMATWSPFTGGSEIAESHMAVAHARSADAQRDAAAANAALESARTADALNVAEAGLAIAEQSVAQSTEALRIIARKYDGGLATISELLEAQAMTTQAGLGLALARYQLIIAAAERRQATGRDLSPLTALDGAAPALERASR